MAETNREGWGKERIQAEMKDVEDAAKVRLYFGYGLGMAAFAGIVGGISFIASPFGGGGFGAVFLIVGIALGLGSFALIKGVLAKRREYKELKKRL